MTTAIKDADALIVVDMLNDFVDPSGHLYSENNAAILPTVEREIRAAIQNRRPVYTVRDCHVPFDPEFQMFPAHALSPWGQSLHHSLRAAIKEESAAFEARTSLLAEVYDVPKRKFSAFYGTDLDQLLRDFRPMALRTLAIVGNCTDICVLYTAADARNRGYGVEIVADAVATFRDTDWHVYAIQMMEHNLGCSIVQLPSAVPV